MAAKPGLAQDAL